MKHRKYIEALVNYASLHPDKEAVYDIATGQRLTYDRLKKNIEIHASYYAEKEICKWDVVLLLTEQLKTLISFYALTSLEAVSLLVNPEIHPEELEYILKNSGATYVISNSSHYAKFEKVIQNHSLLKAVIIPEKPATSFKNENKPVYTGEPAVHDVKPLNDPDEDTIVALLYTYKGVGKYIPVPHRYEGFNIALDGFATYYSCLPCSETDTQLVVLPLHGIFGLFMCGLYTIYRGSRLIFSGPDLYKIPELIYEEQVNFICVIPSLLRVLKRSLSSMKKQDKPKPSLLFFSGGAKIDPAFQKEFIEETGFNVADGYGATEVYPFTVSANTGVIGSVGNFAIENNEVQIRNEKGIPVKHGELGQVWIKVPWLPSMEWNGDNSLSHFFAGEWFNSGDIGYINEGGHLFIIARHFAFTKVRGMMVDLVKIEKLLEQHEAITSARVLALENDKMETELVVHAIGKQVTAKEIKTYLQSHIANYKIPKTILLFNENQN